MLRALMGLLLLLAASDALAQNYTGTDEGDARTKCEQSRAKIASKYPATCIHNVQQKNWQCKGEGAGSGYNCGGLVQFFPVPRPTEVYNLHYYQTGCAARPDVNLRQNMNVYPTVKATECSQGCSYNVNPVALECWTQEDQPGTSDDPKVGYNCRYDMKANGQACVPDNDPPDKPPPEVKPPENCTGTKTRLPDGTCADRGDCPVGQHKVGAKCEPDGSCPTGKVKGPDGSCVDEACPSGQAKGKDGSCKKDDDGDGKPDDGEGDDGKFSGGDSCKEPPKCSGDAIMCGQARIQWRIDCNTRRNTTLTGGTGCAAPPVCAGEKCDAMEYSSLLQQWRTACATEKLANATGGVGGGTGGQPAWTNVTGDGSGGAGAEPTGVVRTVGQGIEGRLDGSGFLGGSGSCPNLGSFDVGTFGVVDLDELPYFCDLLTMTKWILQLVGAFIALGILMGWRLG